MDPKELWSEINTIIETIFHKNCRTKEEHGVALSQNCSNNNSNTELE